MGFARCGVERKLNFQLHFVAKKLFVFQFFCKFEKRKSFFAQFSLSCSFSTSFARTSPILFPLPVMPTNRTAKIDDPKKQV